MLLGSLVISAGLLTCGVPATLVSAMEAFDMLRRLKTELLMLYCVLSVDDGSRLRIGVLDRIGVAGLTASGNREPEPRERSGYPTASGVGLGD